MLETNISRRIIEKVKLLERLEYGVGDMHFIIHLSRDSIIFEDKRIKDSNNNNNERWLSSRICFFRAVHSLKQNAHPLRAIARHFINSRT